VYPQFTAVYSSNYRVYRSARTFKTHRAAAAFMCYLYNEHLTGYHAYGYVCVRPV